MTDSLRPLTSGVAAYPVFPLANSEKHLVECVLSSVEYHLRIEELTPTHHPSLSHKSHIISVISIVLR